MEWDKIENFALSTLNGAVASGDGTLAVQAGDAAAKFPATTAFNCVIWKKSAYAEPQDDPNMEIVRVTNISTDTFSITRGQEGTSPANHEDLDRIELNITKKPIQDLINNKLGNSADVIKDDHIDWGSGSNQVKATVAAAVITDHALVRGDGGVRGVQETGIIVDDSNNVSGIGTLGCGAITSTDNLTVNSGGNIFLQSNITNNTVKYGSISTKHYDTAEQPFYYIIVRTASGANELEIGGGDPAGNAATFIKFYTAANSTTTTGTLALTIQSDQSLLALPTYSQDVGATTRDLLVDSTGLIGYQASSIKYKKNVEDLGLASKKIYDLRPVSFNWKKNQGKGYGLIAEEVEKIMPELVSYKSIIKTKEIKDEEGNIIETKRECIGEDKTQPETVNYSKLIPFILNETISLNKRVEVLENI